MRRQGFLYGVLLLVLGALGGLAWLTHHPETPWLVRAAGWPVVGPLAVRFRAAYLPPGPTPKVEAEEPEAERVTLMRRRRARRVEVPEELVGPVDEVDLGHRGWADRGHGPIVSQSPFPWPARTDDPRGSLC